MNLILSLLPDSASSTAEALAIFLWGIVLVLLSVKHTNQHGASLPASAEVQKPNRSPLVARAS